MHVFYFLIFIHTKNVFKIFQFNNICGNMRQIVMTSPNDSIKWCTPHSTRSSGLCY